MCAKIPVAVWRVENFGLRCNRISFETEMWNKKNHSAISRISFHWTYRAETPADLCRHFSPEWHKWSRECCFRLIFREKCFDHAEFPRVLHESWARAWTVHMIPFCLWHHILDEVTHDTVEASHTTNSSCSYCMWLVSRKMEWPHRRLFGWQMSHWCVGINWEKLICSFIVSVKVYENDI